MSTENAKSSFKRPLSYHDDFGDFLYEYGETTKSLLIEGIFKEYLDFIVPREMVELICLYFGNGEHEKKTIWSVYMKRNNMFGDVVISPSEIKVCKIKAMEKDNKWESFHTWIGIMDSETIGQYNARFYAEFHLSSNGY
eukprot:50742_1